jgi:hypothetical protein
MPSLTYHSRDQSEHGRNRCWCLVIGCKLLKLLMLLRRFFINYSSVASFPQWIAVSSVWLQTKT